MDRGAGDGSFLESPPWLCSAPGSGAHRCPCSEPILPESRHLAMIFVSSAERPQCFRESALARGHVSQVEGLTEKLEAAGVKGLIGLGKHFRGGHALPPNLEHNGIDFPLVATHTGK